MPDFITERLELSEITDRDWDDFLELQSSSEVLRYVRVPEPVEFIRQKFEAALNPWTRDSNGWFSRVIRIYNTQEFVGVTGFKSMWAVNEQAEVGFAIKPNHAGNGYATESLRCIVGFAFNDCRFRKVTAVVNVENLASQRVLQKVGFQQEGRLRDNLRIKDQWYDELVFGLFPPEFI